MRGLVFTLLTIIVGGVLGLGLEYIAHFLPDKIAYEFTRVFTIGIHPIALSVTVCGILGLVIGYVVIAKFVKK